jgi:hypothetical protein
MNEQRYEPAEQLADQTGTPAPLPPDTLRELAIDDALRKIKIAWVAGIVSGVITLAVTLLSMSGTRLFGFNAWSFLDVALIFGLTFGIYRKSRVCAVVMLVYFVLSKIYLWTITPSFIGLLVSLIFLFCYAQGVIGTFRYHSIVTTPQEAS